MIGSGESSKRTKRQVTIATFNKWKTQFEHEHETLSCLCCNEDASDKSIVALLWCQACRTHKHSIMGLKNFSTAWINVSTNQKTSNVLDHAKSNQHHAAMSRVHAEAAKASNTPVTTYSPLARCLLTMNETTKEHMRKKFDMCSVVAKEDLSCLLLFMLLKNGMALMWDFLIRRTSMPRNSLTTLLKASSTAFCNHWLLAIFTVS